LFIFQ